MISTPEGAPARKLCVVNVIVSSADPNVLAFSKPKVVAEVIQVEQI